MMFVSQYEPIKFQECVKQAMYASRSKIKVAVLQVRHGRLSGRQQGRPLGSAPDFLFALVD